MISSALKMTNVADDIKLEMLEESYISSNTGPFRSQATINYTV